MKMSNPKMAAIALKMRTDVFAKVKENIDTLIAELKTDQADEVKTKDFCIKELQQNDMQTAEKTNTKEDLKALIADLETAKGTLTEEIAALKAEIATTYTEMKKAAELRVSQNKEFQMTVTDQVATQKILTKALDRLNEFYAKKSFLQRSSRTAQPGYKKNAASSSVLTMIQNIIEESKEVAADALTAVNEAMAAYDSYMKDSNAAIETMSKSIVTKSEELATVDERKAKADGDLKSTEMDLLKLAEYKMNLHTQCDFVMKYFDIRQQKRAEEIEALQQAKAIFSGANFGF